MSIASSGQDYSNRSTKSACALRLKHAGIIYQRQIPLPITYKGVRLECGYRMDIVVDRKLVIEIKAVEQLLPIHHAQTLTYLRLSGYKVALLKNFNNVTLKGGLRRFVL